MGMYTGIRFKGVIKQEYREDFEKIFTPQDYEWQEEFLWSDSKHEDLAKFGRLRRSRSLRNTGCLDYLMWENDGDVSFNGFDKVSGELNFQCSLKNYNGEIQAFLDIVPNFTSKLHHCEVLYEGWMTGRFYELKGSKLLLTVIETTDYDCYGR